MSMIFDRGALRTSVDILLASAKKPIMEELTLLRSKTRRCGDFAELDARCAASRYMIAKARSHTYDSRLGRQEGIIMMTWGESPMAKDVPADWAMKITHASLIIGNQELTGGELPSSQFESLKDFLSSSI
jgi:hypothetical protein